MWIIAAGIFGICLLLGLMTLGTLRFLFPNVLTEPPCQFKAGFPDEFSPGVDERFKPRFE